MRAGAELKELDKSLLEACESGDMAAARKLLLEGADPSVSDPEGYGVTAAFYLLSRGDVEGLELMEKRGLDVRAGNALRSAWVDKDWLLSEVCGKSWECSLRMAQWLVRERGCELSSANFDPVAQASALGDMEMLGWIFRELGDAALGMDYGLMCQNAVQNGHMEAAEFLAERWIGREGAKGFPSSARQAIARRALDPGEWIEAKIALAERACIDPACAAGSKPPRSAAL